jgi:hypothetical protein
MQAWGIDPLLGELFPSLWNALISTATPNDTWVAQTRVFLGLATCTCARWMLILRWRRPISDDRGRRLRVWCGNLS